MLEILKGIVRFVLSFVVGDVQTNGLAGTAWVDGRDYLGIKGDYELTPHFPMELPIGSYDISQEDFPVPEGTGGHFTSYELVTFSRGTNSLLALIAFWAWSLQRPNKVETEGVIAHYVKKEGQLPVVGLCGAARCSGIGTVDWDCHGRRHVIRMNWFAHWREECQWIAIAPEDVH